MPLRGPRDPVNLTAAAERMPWAAAGRALPGGGGTLAIHALHRPEEGLPDEGTADRVYVVVSGCGVLRCGDAALECTAGDLLFVPAGRAHRFERLDGEMRIWRIAAGPAREGEGG